MKAAATSLIIALSLAGYEFIEKEDQAPIETLFSETNLTKESVPRPKSYGFTFWYSGDRPSESVTNANPNPEIMDHMCGAVRHMKVTTIPDFSKGPEHEAEKAIEYNDNGEPIRNWNYPVDERIVGVQDDRLLLSYRENKVLGIKPDGTITEHELTLSDNDFITEKCPKPIQAMFAPSAYLWCAIMKDAESGATRKLAFEGPCT